jgi:hypothetical protein
MQVWLTDRGTSACASYKSPPLVNTSAQLGSARLGSARLGSAPLRSAPLGSTRLGSARLGSARLFQKLNLLVESFGLLDDLFPFPSILDAGYPVLDLYLANVLFDVILPSYTADYVSFLKV